MLNGGGLPTYTKHHGTPARTRTMGKMVDRKTAKEGRDPYKISSTLQAIDPDSFPIPKFGIILKVAHPYNYQLSMEKKTWTFRFKKKKF